MIGMTTTTAITATMIMMIAANSENIDLGAMTRGEANMITKRNVGALRSIVFALALAFSTTLITNGCNTVQPPARQATDAQITTQVKAKLASDVRASSLANIDVNTTNGLVTLAGEVESPEVRSKAETVAASVPGVVRVNDNLQVAASSAAVNR